jgi:hypothetical protein
MRTATETRQFDKYETDAQELGTNGTILLDSEKGLEISLDRPNKDEDDGQDEFGADGTGFFDSEKASEINDVERSIHETAEKPIDIPPDGGYGWVCVTAVFLINAHTWGMNSVCTFSLYFCYS